MPDFQQRPFFIRLLVPTGDPDGLRIVEKSNWPGVGVVFNRTNDKEVLARVTRAGLFLGDVIRQPFFQPKGPTGGSSPV